MPRGRKRTVTPEQRESNRERYARESAADLTAKRGLKTLAVKTRGEWIVQVVLKHGLSRAGCRPDVPLWWKGVKVWMSYES